MRARQALGLAVVLLTIAAVVRIPARAVGYLVLALPIQTSVYLGTVWRGSAQAVTLAGVPVSAVRWRWLPLKLLAGNLGIDLRVENGADSVRATLGASPTALTVRDLTGRGELVNLPWSRWLGPVRLQGALDIRLDELRIEATQISSANGRLLWRNAVAAVPEPINLGTLQVDVETTGTGIALRVTATGGELDVTGNGAIGANWTYDLRCELTPNRATQTSLKDTLGWLLPQASNGVYVIETKGRLGP